MQGMKKALIGLMLNPWKRVILNGGVWWKRIIIRMIRKCYKMLDRDFYINVQELMSDIDLDRAEPITELCIIEVSGCDVIYND